MISDLTRLTGRSPQPEPVLVVSGGIHYDVVARLPRLPRENDRLPFTELTLGPGGMGGNVAAAFARLGGRARFAGHFSQDDDGVALRADLKRDGVDLRWAGTRPAGEPYRGFVLVGEAGERAILGMWPAGNDPARSPGQAPGLVQRPGPKHSGDWRWPAIDPSVFDSSVAACYCPVSFAPLVLPAVPAGLPVGMDLETGHIDHWNDAEVKVVLGRLSILFGNRANLALLATRFATASVTALSAAIGLPMVETTGATGCVVHHAGEATPVRGYVVPVVDTTGAGDCFAAACLLALLRGGSLLESARFANAAAALSTRRLGSRPGMPDAAELATFLASRPAVPAPHEALVGAGPSPASGA